MALARTLPLASTSTVPVALILATVPLFSGSPRMPVLARVVFTATAVLTSTLPPESILEFEYLGYAAQKIMVGTKTVIDVIMQSDTQLVEEVVVIGYGETTIMVMVLSKPPGVTSTA